MSETPGPRRILRSIGAVFAGLLAMPCAWVGGALRELQSRARAGGYPGVSSSS